MYKAYKFRLYPSEHQKVLISKIFGSYRFIYNHFLSKCNENKYIKAYDMCKMLKELEIEYVWLKEVDSCALRCAIFNLEDAYKNFFNISFSFAYFSPFEVATKSFTPKSNPTILFGITFSWFRLDSCTTTLT